MADVIFEVLVKPICKDWE